MARRIFDPTNVHSAISDTVGGGFDETVDEVAEAVENNAVVLVAMAQNPFCKKARALLDATGVTYIYLEYGSYFSEWKRRGAIKMWSGWITFPMVFVSGTLVGGYSDLQALVESGEFEKMLEKTAN